MGPLILLQGKGTDPLGAGIPAACDGADEGRQVVVVAMTLAAVMMMGVVVPMVWQSW